MLKQSEADEGEDTQHDPSKFGSFRQVEPIDFFPTYYPALAPPTEPQPPAGSLAPTLPTLASYALRTKVAARAGTARLGNK